MISNKTKQQIIEATKVEDVVGEFVSLRKRGINLTGLCPFHHEKSPSFAVNPTRNIYKCFGCGKGGDGITFLMEHENMSFPDALRWLAKKYNIEIEETQLTAEMIAEQQQEASLYIVNEFAKDFYANQLFNTDEGKSIALPYFKKRGLSEETIRLFGLGYATDAKDALVKSAQTGGYNIELLKKTGLSSKEGNRDFFRSRVMFSIYNMSGKIAAFAGRTMSADKTIPKYVNSPETEIYVKNKILYGIFQGKQAIRKLDECILVEGYMDVISLFQSGIQHVVASSGTALTDGQIQLIRRQTNNLTLIYDADSAGFNAAVKGFAMALREGMNVRIVQLPPGEDPDSFVQTNGKDATEAYIRTNEKDIVLFLAEKRMKEVGNDPIRKSALVREISEIIAQCPDAVRRDIYIKECNSILQIDMGALISEVNKILKKDVQKWQDKQNAAPSAASDSPGDDFYAQEAAQAAADGAAPPQAVPQSMRKGDEYQEKDILRLIVSFGDKKLPNTSVSLAAYILGDIEETIDDFDNKFYGKIAAASLNCLAQGQEVTPDFFLKHSEADIQRFAQEVLTSPFEMSANWIDKYQLPLQNQPMPEVNFDNDTRQALDRFKLRKLMKMCDSNNQRIKAASDKGDIEEMLRYIRVQQKLLEVRNDLAKRTGTIILK